MNVGLHSRTDFTVLSVYFGALHWCFGESGCLGDRSIKPKGSLMIGRNIPLIPSGCHVYYSGMSRMGIMKWCFVFCFFSSLHSCGYFLHKVRSCIVSSPGGRWWWICDERFNPNWVLPFTYCNWFLLHLTFAGSSDLSACSPVITLIVDMVNMVKIFRFAFVLSLKKRT